MIWRLHIKPDWSKGKTRADVINYCIDNKVAGIGWPVNPVPQSVDAYALAAKSKYGNRCSAIPFAMKTSVGDLIWSRDENGTYYLGRVNSSWIYCNDDECLSLDIPNQLSCEWVKIKSEDYVPGRIVASFRARRSFQQIDDSMALYSEWIYNAINQNSITSLLSKSDIKLKNDFFSFISSEDCEDIVGLYLQKNLSYYLIPSSCKSDTIGVEFRLKNFQNGTTAVAQVKQGKVDLDERLIDNADRIFLFTTQGNAKSSSEKITTLSVDEMRVFIEECTALMPEKIKIWINIYDNLNTQSLLRPVII